MRVTDVNGDLPRIINNRDHVYLGNLRHYFRVLFRQTANSNGYHNFRHPCHVLWVCYESLRHPAYRREIPVRKGRNLMIAALSHDFEHSGLPQNDREQIIRAIRGLERHLLPEDAGEIDDISALMVTTEFPHRIETAKLPLEAQILRDGDCSQCFSPVWIQDVVFGLAEERGVSPLEVLRHQEGFMRGLTFSTKWAQGVFTKKVIDAKIEEVRGLLEILDSQA